MAQQLAVIIGASGGIGTALCEELESGAEFDQVIRLGRPELDLCDEASVYQSATSLPGVPSREWLEFGRRISEAPLHYPVRRPDQGSARRVFRRGFSSRRLFA